MKTVGRMTLRELEHVMEKVVEQKLFELIGDPDQGLELHNSIKRRLRRTLRDERRGKGGIPAQEVAKRLGLRW